MDKAILKKFAIESRQDLMSKIKNKINTYYIDEEFTKEQKGDLYILSNSKHSLSLTNEEYKKRELLIKPNITTRGFILINENEELIRKIENEAEKIVRKSLEDKKSTFATIKSKINIEMTPYIHNLTDRRPIVLPVILDIKKNDSN